MLFTMKKNAQIIFIISAIWFLAGCGTPEKKTTETRSALDAENISVSASNSLNNIDSIYFSLPVLNLPLEFSINLLDNFSNYKHIGEKDFHRFTDIGDLKSNYDNTLRAVRLQLKDSIKFIITGHKEPNEEWLLELYSLTDELIPIDRLQLYSIEEVGGGANVISQTFKITDGYRIIVSKHFNDTLIEQLTYMPAANGIFEEVRDGKTTTVAFESYDGTNYIVETFIWDHNSSGGLIKKDLKTENYRITESGRFIKVEPITQQTSRTVNMRITPQKYQSAPEKITLSISNNTKETIQFGAYYEVEKSVNGKWIKQKFSDEIAFIEIMYILEPGKKETYEINLFPDMAKYEAGNYRIRKNILIGEENNPEYAYFSITG